MMKNSIAATAVALSLVGTGALAATLETINLGAPTNQANSISFDGLGTTDLFTVKPIPEFQGQVYQNGNGLGMDTWVLPDSNQLGGLETLGFYFTRDVKFHSLTFTAFNENVENYTIVVDVTGAPIDVTLGGNDNPFNFGMLVGDFFSVSALGVRDSFRISSLTISEVPVPAAGFLLVGALGGLAALRRKKRKEA